MTQRPKPLAKPKTLATWITKNTKKKQDQCLKFRDDPVARRQFLVSKVCEARSNIQKMENQHQKYLKQIIALNQQQKMCYNQQQVVCKYILEEDISNSGNSLFDLARQKCVRQDVTMNVLVSKQAQIEPKNQIIDTKQLMSIQINPIELSVEKEIQIQSNNVLIDEQKDYGVKKLALTPKLIKEFEQYQRTGAIPQQYLVDYQADFPSFLKLLAQNYQQ